MTLARNATLTALGLLCAALTGADDWPQWRGPERDGVSRETELLTSWPKAGPRLLWSATGIGAGYGSPAIASGRIYVTGRVDKQEKLSALDLNGRLKWEQTYGRAWTGSFPDARTTPTIIDSSVYVISGMGEIACHDADTGRVKWSRDAKTQFAGRTGLWGTAESPLIVGDKLIYTPAGSKTTVVALDRHTGRTVWASKSLEDQSGYVSPIVIPVAGRQQIVAMTGNFALGVNAHDGSIEWKVRFGDIGVTEEGGDITTNTPIHRDGRVFITSGYNHTGAMLRLAKDGRGATVEWVAPVLDNHHGHVVLVGDHLYGSNWVNNSKGNWVCLDWHTGRPAYEAQWATKGSIITAERMLYVYDEREGNLALVNATPDGFRPVSSFRIAKGDGPHWAHPAISDRVLFVRHGDVLMAHAIKAARAAMR